MALSTKLREKYFTRIQILREELEVLKFNNIEPTDITFSRIDEINAEIQKLYAKINA